jgi:hypothetical protein
MDKSEIDVLVSLPHCNLETRSYNFADESSSFSASFLCLVCPVSIAKRKTCALLGKKFSISKRNFAKCTSIYQCHPPKLSEEQLHRCFLVAQIVEKLVEKEAGEIGLLDIQCELLIEWKAQYFLQK